MAQCGVLDVTSPAQRYAIKNRTQNSIRANQVYCQLYRMNYGGIWPHIRSTSETCLKQVLGSLRLPGTLQHGVLIASARAAIS